MSCLKIQIIPQELKKALMMRKTGESEDEFVVNEADDMNDDGDKDSDSGMQYPCNSQRITEFVHKIEPVSNKSNKKRQFP